jgi:hypothetical protein
MDPPLGNTNPRLSHASDRLDPSYTRTCTCTRQRPRARRRARTTFPGETLCVQRCVTLQRLLACARAWYQSSAISVTFRTLCRDPRGDLRKVPREGTFDSNDRPSKQRCSPVTVRLRDGLAFISIVDLRATVHARIIACMVPFSDGKHGQHDTNSVRGSGFCNLTLTRTCKGRERRFGRPQAANMSL